MRKQASHKRERLQADLYRGISELILKDIRDSRVVEASPILQEVSLNKDSSLAKVYISFLKDDLKENDKTEVLKILKKASGYFRSRLASNIKTRSVPRIEFYYDSIKDEMEKVDQLLAQEKEELSRILKSPSNESGEES